MPRPYYSEQSPDPDLPTAVNALRRYGRLARRANDILSQWSLTWPLLDVLLAIREAGQPIGIREHARRIHETADVPRAIKRLRDLGYLTTIEHPEDARKQAPCLTESGQNACSDALLALEEGVGEEVSNPARVLDASP